MSSGSNSLENKNINGQRGRWTPLEDAKLKRHVEQYGPTNWNILCPHLSGRTGKSCRQRWHNELSPSVNKGPFTKEEEERFFEAHRIHGNRWAFIARMFPGRTSNTLKNHYHLTMARRRRNGLSSTPTSCQMDNSRGPSPYTSASAPRSDQLGSSSISNAQQEIIDPERRKSNEMVDHQAATADHEKNSSGEDGTSMIDHGEKRDIPFYDFLGVGLDS